MKVKIPNFILTKLKGIKNEEAVLLTGSQATGKATGNSDWDFFIILKDGAPRWRKTTKLKNTWLELFCNNQKQIKKEFKEDLDEGRGITTQMFATGQIVEDNKNKILTKLVKQAKNNWKKGPHKLTGVKLGWINYNLSTYIQDLEDCLHDNNPAHLLINHAANEFINYFYRLGNLWMPRPKDRLNNLRKQDPKIYNLIQKINRANNWQQKTKLTIQLGKSVANIYGLNLSGETYIPPKKN